MAATNKAKSLDKLGRNRQEEVREKIKATLLINKLQNHIDGIIELSTSQVAAAKILLDKSVSNAPQIIDQKTEHTGSINHAISQVPQLTKEEWMEAHGLGSTARATK
jgi:hypothetical protein